MDQIRRGLVALLKSAVTQQPCPLPERFSPEQAQELISRHHIAALCYDGAVRCGVTNADGSMAALFQGYCKALLVSERQMAALAAVTDAFDAAGVDYMVLKGGRMKALYPKPELRTMGDADVLIRMEQYETVRALLPGLGFREGNETDHELVWRSPELYLELHKSLVPTYHTKLYAYYGDGWRLALLEQGRGYAMKAQDEFVYLFTHFAKHCRDGGIGCRHVVDLWVYLRAHPELEQEALQRTLDGLELGAFYRNVRGLMVWWFEDGPADPRLEALAEFIFASGSWGDRESKALAQALEGNSALGGRLRYIRKNLFPAASVISGKYPVLKKAPWLLPAAWIYRLGEKALFDRESVRNRAAGLKAFQADALTRRKELLEYVGLNAGGKK